MKIFVTGHTSGIGMAFYNLAVAQGYDVTGGSRRTGFDLSNLSTYSQILDYDILINNAYHVSGQLDLLKFAYNKWANTPKIIINVGSANKDIQKNRPFERLNYNVSKKSLEVYSFWISENDKICKSMMYNPGFVRTPLAMNGMQGWPELDQTHALSNSLDKEECASTILFMMNTKHKFKEITHIG